MFKRKILITGGAGFIPSSLADYLLQDPDNFVVAIDNFHTGKHENIPNQIMDNYRFIKCDVNRYQEILPIMASHSFDYVFHYAAVVGVQRTLNNPVSVLHDIQGIRNVLDLCKSTGVKRIFYASSSEVYGEPVELPQNELTTPLNSRLPYAVVKNVGEAYCRSYQLEYDLNYTIFRFFNTYGPRQSTDFVMSKFLKAALSNKPITIFGTGTQTRTFCFIQDNLEATTNCLFQDKFVNDVVNVGNDREFTILELAKSIISICDSRSIIQHVEALKEGDMTRRLPDITKMKQLLNRPLHKVEDGIKILINSGKFN